MGSAADYLEDPLFGHTRYRKIKDLNEGTFGIVLLALDVRTNEQVVTIPGLSCAFILVEDHFVTSASYECDVINTQRFPKF